MQNFGQISRKLIIVSGKMTIPKGTTTYITLYITYYI